MENPIKTDDLGGTLIFGNTQLLFQEGRLLQEGFLAFDFERVLILNQLSTSNFTS